MARENILGVSPLRLSRNAPSSSVEMTGVGVLCSWKHPTLLYLPRKSSFCAFIQHLASPPCETHAGLARTGLLSIVPLRRDCGDHEKTNFSRHQISLLWPCSRHSFILWFQWRLYKHQNSRVLPRRGSAILALAL